MLERTETHQPLALLLETGAFAAIVIRRDGAIAEANPRARELLGTSFAPDSRIGDVLDLAPHQLRELLAVQEVWRGEAAIPHGDGPPLEVLVVGLPHADGVMVFLQVKLAPVLELHQHRGTLVREMTGMLRERTRDASALTEALHRIESQAEELQAQNEELVAQTEELQAQAEELEGQAEELEEQRGELTRLTEELRHRTEVLAAEEERHRLLVEDVQDYAIFALDPKGRILTWNEGAQAILGYKEIEVVGEPASIFEAPEAREEGRISLEVAAAITRRRHHSETWLVRKDGSRFWADVVTTTLRVGDKLVGFSRIIRDLTERQALEQERAQVAALTELDALKNQFLGILSHELRTPINAITGFGSILEDEMAGPLGEAQRYYLNKMLGGAEHLLALVDDLLEMSRIQAGRFEIDPRPVDLAELLTRAVAHPLLPIGQKRQVVQLELPPMLPPVMADELRIMSLLLKLLHNASKFTPHGGTIVLRAWPEAGELLCQVEDDGCGVPPDAVERIFLPFSQENMTSTREHGGTGLGLAICKAIAEAHGGRIGVESHPDRGASFWFTLPLAQ